MVDIRKAKEEDWKEIQRLNQKLFDLEYKEAFDRTIDPAWPVSDAGIAHYKEVVTSPDCCTCIAEENGEVCGYLSVNYKQDSFYDSYRKNVFVAELDHMFVEESFRKKRRWKSSFNKSGRMV